MSVTVPGLFRAGAVHSKYSLLASVCFNLRLVRKHKIVITERYIWHKYQMSLTKH